MGYGGSLISSDFGAQDITTTGNINGTNLGGNGIFVPATGGYYYFITNLGIADVVLLRGNDGVKPVWMANEGGKVRVTANVTNATTTMSNLSDLSIALSAGRKYSGTFTFFAKDSTAADGIAFDFNGGSATMTSVEFGFAATPPGVTLGTVISTALGTALTATVATTTNVVYTIAFTCVCNAAGTLIPRFAQVAHTTGTATAGLGSHGLLNDMNS